MKRTVFILFFIIIISSCKEENTTQNHPDTLLINLVTKGTESPFGGANRPFRFMDSIPEVFKGIVNKDSTFLMYHNTIGTKDLEKLIVDKKSTKEELSFIQTKLYCLSGFNNGKQFFVYDTNDNKDFSDDKMVEFDKNIIEKEDYLDSFIVKVIEINKLNGDAFYKDSSYIKIYPAPNYFTYKKETEKEKFKHSLQLATQTTDYKYGIFDYDNTNYKVAANKGWKGHEFIFRESDSAFYERNHQLYAEYLIKDTIKLKDTYYRLDTILLNPSRLTLNRIHGQEPFYGFRTNEISKNYEITDLDGNKSHFNDQFKGKDFILLDFWGTWCAPCKELTPDLVELHNKHKTKINFVSLAFQKDPNPVREYVTKNKMDWYNGLIKGKPKSGDQSSKIISGLRIECYPTFIVMDSKLNILYRTCGGGPNFLDLTTFLNSLTIE